MRKQIPRCLHISLSSGALEALKWIALVLMTLDHINTFLFNGKFPLLFNLGRLAMPVFGFVLAYNLARAQGRQNGVYRRTMQRLVLAGLLAAPAFIAMVGWLPLNIMFTLLVAACAMYLLERGSGTHAALAAMVLAAGGALVEFQWYGVLYCLAAWSYCKRPSGPRLAGWIASAASLYLVNYNFWALAAVPLIIVVSRLSLRLPRVRHIFYVYYPAHLGVLWMASKFA
jgi:hypothetical protein